MQEGPKEGAVAGDCSGALRDLELQSHVGYDASKAADLKRRVVGSLGCLLLFSRDEEAEGEEGQQHRAGCPGTAETLQS